MKLAACFAALAMAKKVDYNDCTTNGVSMPVDTTFLQKVVCNSRNSCKPVCKKGAVAVGKKRFICDKRGKSYRFKPFTNFPKCIGCQGLRELVDPNVKINGNMIFCPAGQKLDNFGANWMTINCKCDTSTEVCNWNDKHGRNINSDVSGVKCVEAASGKPTGPRLPAGLTCKREDGTRIVGGQEADPNTWPWMVQLEYYGSFNCGAVIVGENLVLTAGHCCAVFSNIAKLTGRVGDLNKGQGTTIEFKKKVIHPNYNKPKRQAENDICLLFPKRAIKMSPGKIDRACLPHQDEAKPPAGTRCWTAGFGMMKWFGASANKLMEVDVKLFGDRECDQTRVGSIFESSMHTCAGWHEGKKDACIGDSGGPLICVAEDEQPMLWGLTSQGIKCAEKNAPGIYTRVEKYTNWINYHITNTLGVIRANKKRYMEEQGTSHKQSFAQIAKLVTEQGHI